MEEEKTEMREVRLAEELVGIRKSRRFGSLGSLGTMSAMGLLLSACGGGSSGGGGGGVTTDTTAPQLADGDSVKSGVQSLTIDSTSGSAYKLKVHFGERIKVDTSKTDIGSYITIYRKKSGESGFTELTGSVSDLSVGGETLLGSSSGYLEITLNENGDGAGEDYSLEGSTYRVKFIKTGLVSDIAGNALAKDTETSEAEVVRTDSTSPVLASKTVEVKKVAGEADARELVVTFSENVNLRDASKVKLVRTHGDDGVVLSTEQNVEITSGNVKASGKTVSVKFTPSGHSKYKLVFEAGSVEDAAGNGFTPVDIPAGSTDDVDALNNAPTFSDSLESTVNAYEGVGGSVGTYGASDSDDDTLTYSLAGTNAALFDIDSASGAVSWKTGTKAPAHGSSNTYSFTVVAKDGFGGEARHDVTLTVVEVTGPLPPEQVELYDEDAPTTPVTGLTNKTKLKILKVAVSEALSSGDSVEFFDGNVSLGTTTLSDSVASGAKVTLTLATALSGDRLHSLTAKVTIAAGSKQGTSSAGTPLTFTLDTTAPDAPDVSLSGGVTKGETTYTKSNTPTFTVTGLETGSTVKLYKDVAGTLTEIGSGVVSSGTSLEVAASSSLGADGVYSVVVKEVDKAGNEGGGSSKLTFTVDTAAPAKPTVVFNDPSAVVEVGGAKYTKATSLVFKVGGVESGGTAKLYRKGGTQIAVTPTASGNFWLFTVDVSSWAEASYTLVAKVEDAAGNESVASTDLSFTLDKTAPGAPGSFSLNGGVVSGGTTYTKSNTPTFTVTGLETGSTVNLYLSSDTTFTTVIGTAVVSSGTTVQVTVASSLGADGAYSVVAREVDAVGNVGTASDALTFTVDATAPLFPGILVKDVQSERNIRDNERFITNNRAPEVTLLAQDRHKPKINFEKGTKLTLTVSFTESGTKKSFVLTKTVTEANVLEVNFSIVRPDGLALSATRYSLDVVAEDKAGNTASGDPRYADAEIELHFTAPLKPKSFTLTSPLTSGYLTFALVKADGDLALNDGFETRFVYIKGKEGAGEEVGLRKQFRTDIVSSIEATNFLKNGSYTFVAKVVDAAGNVGATSDDLKVTLVAPPDTTYSPTNPFLLDVAAKKITVSFDQTIASFDSSKIKVYYDADGSGSASTKALLVLTTNYTISIVGGKIEIALTKSDALVSGSEYSVKFEANAVTDNTGVKNDALAEAIASTDKTDPAFAATSLSLTTGFSLGTVTITFDENIKIVSGLTYAQMGLKIQIIRNGVDYNFALSDDPAATNNKLSFDTANLQTRFHPDGTEYQVRIAAGLVEDLAGNDFAGGLTSKFTIKRSASEEDDLVGLGTTSDADYGF